MTGYNEIEATDLFDMMAKQKLTLVDVRNDDEVARGIITGSLHIPLAMIPVKTDDLSKDDHALVFFATAAYALRKQLHSLPTKAAKTSTTCAVGF